MYKAANVKLMLSYNMSSCLLFLFHIPFCAAITFFSQELQYFVFFDHLVRYSIIVHSPSWQVLVHTCTLTLPFRLFSECKYQWWSKVSKECSLGLSDIINWTSRHFCHSGLCISGIPRYLCKV